MKLRALSGAVVLFLAGCGASTTPATSTTPTIPSNGPITYTVEPFDMDGTLGITMTVTQLQFGGKMCPCVKIPYPADGFHDQQGADAINAASAKFKPGDTLMGFSLGVQVISLYLSKHTLPAGVHVLLAGDTFARNDSLNSTGAGIPANIANDVTMVVNEYDGWSDLPTKTSSPNWLLAEGNSTAGTQIMHYYINADVKNPANVVTHRGNITAILVPTQRLPRNDWMRLLGGNAAADALDIKQRPLINDAYDRPGSNTQQQAAASAEQVPYPQPAITQKPEPVFGK